MLNWQFASPRYWLAWMGFGILWLLTRLPECLQFQIGKGIGHLLYSFPTKLKNTTRTNIKICFPELSLQQQNQIVKKNFLSLGIGLIETARAWWLPDKKLQHSFQLNGIEHLDAAFSKGKGVIVVSPHFTSLEMMGRLLGMHYSFAAMFRAHKKSLIAYIQTRFRKNYRIHLIPRQNMRELLRVLNQNTAVWFAYDIDAGEKRSVFAPFFNIPTASLTTASRVAELTGAAVIAVNFYRDDEKFRYEINLSPPLENFPGKNLLEDATRLNALLEKSIRHKPEQYVWQYKRFKTRPAGEKRFY